MSNKNAMMIFRIRVNLCWPVWTMLLFIAWSQEGASLGHVLSLSIPTLYGLTSTGRQYRLHSSSLTLRSFSPLKILTLTGRSLKSSNGSSESDVRLNSSKVSATTNQSWKFQPPEKPASHYDAIVCGGGPAGLLVAIMLSQKYGPSYRIAVCERRAAVPPSPSDETVWNDVARFYLLGIGHRGQAALEKFGVLEDFINASVEIQGRRDWQPGMTAVEDGRIAPAKKDPPSRIIARDKLVGLLHEHLVLVYIQKREAKIDLLYGYQVDPLSFGSAPEDPVSVRISKCQDITESDESSISYKASQDSKQICRVDEYLEATTNFLIGADGASRSVARVIEANDIERYSNLNILQKIFSERPFRITRFKDDNPRVYKSVPILLPPDWPRGLNYSARSRNNRITLEALPSDNKGNLCTLLLMKPDDELAQPNVDPVLLRNFFSEEFPQFGALVDEEEMAKVAQKPASKLPAFRFVGPRLNKGHRTLILGDAAHTVKPYYGLGANTALEDVQVLSDILDKSGNNPENRGGDPIPTAVHSFSNERAADSAALVTISRNMDRPGKLFIINFLLPIILDGIFHKIAPQMFGPNMFGMFQKKGIGFKQIQRKKRLDRALQMLFLGIIGTVTILIVKSILGVLAKATGKSQGFVSLVVFLASFVTVGCRKLAARQKVVER